jgi:hypothetical protein
LENETMMSLFVQQREGLMNVIKQFLGRNFVMTVTVFLLDAQVNQRRRNPKEWQNKPASEP